MLKTFNNYLLEQEQNPAIARIAQDPLFKLKEKSGTLINQILNTFKNISQDTKLDIVKNKIMAFKSDLEDINKEFNSAIENQRTLNAYKKHYDQVIGTLSNFENPSVDINQSIQNAIKALNVLFVFIQSRISI